MKKFKCWGWCLVIAGVILIIDACFTPKVMEAVITSQAQKAAQLTAANEADWRGIPGTYDIDILWKHYLYNCTNYEEVSISDTRLISTLLPTGCLQQSSTRLRGIRTVHLS